VSGDAMVVRRRALLYGNNKKAPPGQTNYFKFLFSGAPLKDSEFFSGASPKDFKFFSRRFQSVQEFFQEAAEVSSVFSGGNIVKY
jgi:hypothetical protein